MAKNIKNICGSGMQKRKNIPSQTEGQAVH